MSQHVDPKRPHEKAAPAKVADNNFGPLIWQEDRKVITGGGESRIVQAEPLELTYSQKAGYSNAKKLPARFHARRAKEKKTWK